MTRRKPARRTPTQAAADRKSDDLARKLGLMLCDGRTRLRLKQSEAADRAGISRGRWADLEAGRGSGATLRTISRSAAAVGGSLDAWIKTTSAADQPRDAVHLRNQELIIRLAGPGGWTPRPEELIDRDARTSRAADVLLHRRRPGRPAEYALWSVTDWIDDVGAIVRDFARRVDAVERYAIARMLPDEPLPRTGGCWVVRATQRNRRLIGEHRHFFRACFPGSGRAWLASPATPTAQLPQEPALIWVSVNGERLFPARLSALE